MKCLIIFCWLCLNFDINAQENNFKIKDDKRSEKIKFELFNNLIIIPVKVNDVELKFLLDSGVDKTVLFSFEQIDSLALKNTKSIRVKGISGVESIEAYKSSNNRIKIKNIYNNQSDIYVIFDQENYLSGSIGTVINGVIGYDLLKDFVIRFDYELKRLKFYTPSKFHRPLVFYKDRSLSFINNKPHLKAEISDGEMGRHKDRFLLDTGSGDAVWVYQNDSIVLPKAKFEDNLGFGFQGVITGYRSKADRFQIADFTFDNVNIAIPNFDNAITQRRIGAIGGEILKRFKFFLSYPDKKIFLKNNSFFKDEFIYDKSGLLLRYGGLSIVEKQIPVKVSLQKSSSESYGSINNDNTYKTIYEIKKMITIAGIRKDSPASKVDLQVDDLIMQLQGKNINRYDLKGVRELLSSEKGKQIEMQINRNGVSKKVKFKLEDRMY